jgi:hypothetical protein
MGLNRVVGGVNPADDAQEGVVDLQAAVVLDEAERGVVDVRGNISNASEHPDDPQQESHAQRNRSSDSQDHDGDADRDAQKRKEVADDGSGATEWAGNDE